MKKTFILFLVLLFILTSCNSNNTNNKINLSEISTEDKNNENNIQNTSNFTIKEEIKNSSKTDSVKIKVKSEKNIEPKIEIENKSNKKIITLNKDEIKTINLRDKEYKIQINEIFDDSIANIKINDVLQNEFVNIFNKESVGNLYILLLETFESFDENNNSYAQIMIGDYEFTFNSSDTDKICYQNGNIEEDKTVVYTLTNGEFFEVIESYCIDDSNLMEYSCKGTNGWYKNEKIPCLYGCENGKCLQQNTIICEKDEYESGIKVLLEGQNIKVDDSTVLELIEVEDGEVNIKVNEETRNVKKCTRTILTEDRRLLIHDTIPSQRTEVKGYIEFSYK